MRILLANKFYYRCGGECVRTLNLEELLKVQLEYHLPCINLHGVESSFICLI